MSVPTVAGRPRWWRPPVCRVRMLALASVAVLAVSAGCSESSGPRGASARFAWTHTNAAGAISQPYADSDIVVFTTFQDSAVVALDARTGIVRWEKHLSPPAGAPFTCTLGCFPEANIAASGNVIVVPGWDVYGLDRSTGAVRWKFATADDFPGSGNVAVADGRVYTEGDRLYALDASTGTLEWQADLGGVPFRPVIADGVIYVETRSFIDTVQSGLGTLGNGSAMAVDAATGKILWRFSIEDPEPGNGGSVGPAFVTADLVIVTGMNGHVYALDRATGQPRWIANGSGPYPAGAVVVDNTVITAGSAGSIDGFSLATGQPLWHTPDTAPVSTGQFQVTGPGSSVFHPITLGDGVALISAGWVAGVDATGKIRWHDGGAGFGGPVYSTSATFRNGIIYVGAADQSTGAGFYALRAPK